jgi:UDP-N-acetylmuramate--alanine ligase
MSAGALPWRGRRLHFVGVGGAGMSGYARLARALGAEVSGSDRANSPYAERLAADGILQASIGHAVENLPAGEELEVIYSSAVPEDNVERRVARERGLAERSRAELLSELTGLRRTVAVAGTHGKTTTAAMLVHALRAAGLAPGWMVGGFLGEGEPNACWGEGEWLVVEADESDRSMLSLNVDVAVLTNVELDHHTAFASLAELREAFASFLAGARVAIVLWNQPALLELAPRGSHPPPAPAGERGNAAAIELVPYEAPRAALGPDGSRFRWRGREVRLAVPGAHNALNAVAALEAARLTGADEAAAARGLAGFRGAARRFQLVGRSARGARVYDDYAHHPTEVAATLQAARTLEPQRLVAAFQPHLFSRTALLAREFGRTLALADATVVLDVYPAREQAEEYPGVSGLVIAEATADCAEGRPVYWLPRFADAAPALQGLLAAGDVCVIMGAGDVDALARMLVGA